MQSIVKKSFLIVAVATLIMTVYFTAGVLIFANNQYNKINTGNLEEAVKILSEFTPAAVFMDTKAAADWVSGLDSYLKRNSSYRITLINRNGQIIFDGSADSAIMESHLDRPEFQSAIRDGIGTARRRSTTLGQHYIYAAVSISDASGEFRGVLRLSNLAPSLLGITLPFITGGFIIILGACAGLYIFSRRLSYSVEAELDAELKKLTAEYKAQAEETRAESRHREVILNSMFDGILTLDSSLNIVNANPRICSLFGAGKEKNVRGMPLLEFCRLANLDEAARQVLVSGQPHELTIKRFYAGAQQHFQVYAAPLDKSGVVIALGDISRLVKLEQVRKDFAANVSHELRTPIQIIQGFAENIMNSSLDNKEEIRYFTGIIIKNAGCMENLTNDLLTLVSLEDENAARSLPVETVLEPLITEAVDMVIAAARKKNITLDISCPQDLIVTLHGSLLIQALVNLLDNGIKYSGIDSKIQVSALLKDSELIIEVKDNGSGIPAGHIDRIFERFYRIDRARSREEGGTGLGLSIVRHIAVLHRGTVEVESHAGEGSVFRLRLPVQYF